MRWLIAVALNESSLTYGGLKRLLEERDGFSTIFPTRIGWVAGAMMETIQAVEPNAPLLNVLVVSQTDETPSRGAGEFMAKRFGERRLAASGYKKQNPNSWQRYFNKAASEVYAYSADDWARLYKKVFGQPLQSDLIRDARNNLQQGNEEDSGGGAFKYGPGGEGPAHRALRLWVMNNPAHIHGAFAKARTETEFGLDSGDRVDVVYHLPDRSVMIEVKSRISNVVDLHRGVFQCVKYRAVKQAMDVRANPIVEVFLITETKLPGEIKALLKRHNIRHVQVPLERS
ncbi:hypothetical protein [uncultured Brevundimonas sp.]|uniref:hypothetical protein n=1 Tax=uncultured Brevundimonas sp. TaxID=213418 RepID=UPI0025E0B67E|nr:hypothetical protein [uncultured Brevundimonas sp.]